MSDCYVNLIGGLGNQLFQIAAGYAYAKKYDKRLIINANNWFGGQGTHGFTYKNTIFKNFEYGSPTSRDVVSINENQFNYSEIPYHSANVSLHGYFQSLRYFEEYKDEFVSLLDLPKVEVDHIKCGSPMIVGFHIRRGDYLMYAPIHYVCHTKYFEYFFQKFQDFPIKVFTDSSSHVLTEFKYKYDIIQSISDLEDFTYMTKCDILVGSNSTFSWWASLISGNRCYFPSKWFADGRPHEDIYRKDMIIHNV